MQSLVLVGKFGGTPGAMKLFLSLGTSQLQQELLQRGITDVSLPKKDLLCELNSILRGVKRVPALLILNPSQCLAEMGCKNSHNRGFKIPEWASKCH